MGGGGEGAPRGPSCCPTWPPAALTHTHTHTHTHSCRLARPATRLSRPLASAPSRRPYRRRRTACRGRPDGPPDRPAANSTTLNGSNTRQPERQRWPAEERRRSDAAPHRREHVACPGCGPPLAALPQQAAGDGRRRGGRRTGGGAGGPGPWCRRAGCASWPAWQHPPPPPPPRFIPASRYRASRRAG